MAPNIHPPCTPSASCAPIRCHPTPPPCQNPEKCLKRTISKGIKPCQSAVSILSTRAKTTCKQCGKYKGSHKPRNVSNIEKFLSVKSKEARMRKRDRLKGTHLYLKYVRRKGSRKSKTDCCAGHGHRGRLKRAGKCCEIL